MQKSKNVHPEEISMSGGSLPKTREKAPFDMERGKVDGLGGDPTRRHGRIDTLVVI